MMAIDVDLLVRVTVFITLLTLLFSRHLSHAIMGILWLVLAFGHGWPWLDLISADPSGDVVLAQTFREALDLPALRVMLAAVTLLGCLVVLFKRRSERGSVRSIERTVRKR